MKQALRNIANLPKEAKVQYLAILLCVFIVAWSLAALFGEDVKAAWVAWQACGYVC
jgi:hypothetical protein